jgi:glycosyltransferase involved in cell wall biosynthesis
MKVLFITRKFPPPDNLGAVATILWEVANGLVDRGIEVAVIAGSYTPTMEEHPREGLEIYRFPSANGFVNTIRIARIISRLYREIDIVHIHDVLPIGQLLLLYLSLLPVKKFWTLHNLAPICKNSVLWSPCSMHRDEVIEGKRGLCHIDRDTSCRNCFSRGPVGILQYLRFTISSRLTHGMARFLHILTPSRSTKRVLTKTWGERVVVLPNAVDIQDPGPSNHGDYPTKVFFGGRIVPEKGLDLLIDSMKYNPGIILTASGTGREKYIENLEERARGLGIEYNRADWKPRDLYLSDLKNFDICVVPSRGFEVFGMVALDAEMAGLPLVLADQGGLREVGEDGKNTVFFERGSRDSLARSISVLAENPFLRHRYSKMSKKIVQARYGIRRHVDSLVNLYRRALEEDSK